MNLYLAIGKNTNIVSVDCALNQLAYFLENCRLTCSLSEHVVKLKLFDHVKKQNKNYLKYIEIENIKSTWNFSTFPFALPVVFSEPNQIKLYFHRFTVLQYEKIMVQKLIPRYFLPFGFEISRLLLLLIEMCLIS